MQVPEPHADDCGSHGVWPPHLHVAPRQARGGQRGQAAADARVRRRKVGPPHPHRCVQYLEQRPPEGRPLRSFQGKFSFLIPLPNAQGRGIAIHGPSIAIHGPSIAIHGFQYGQVQLPQWLPKPGITPPAS